MSETPTDHPKAKRRRLQFSLRTMFVVLTASAVVLGFISKPIMQRRREQEILRTIGFQNVSAEYVYIPASGDWIFSSILGSAVYQRVHQLSLTGRVPEDVDLGRLAELTHLRKLSFSGTRVSDAELAGLSELARLEELDLSDTQVTDAGLVHLEGLKELKQLRVAGTEVTYEALERLQPALPSAEDLVQRRAVEELERARAFIEPQDAPSSGLVTAVRFTGGFRDADLSHLVRLRQIRRLHLIHHGTDNSLKLLKDLQTLEELELRYTQVTGEGLKHLAGLTNLKVLRLSESRIDDAGLKHLIGLKNLEQLNLDRSRITGLGLAHLKDLPQLRVLELAEVPYIYDVDLGALQEMKTLRYLGLSGARISKAGLARLQASLPNTKIRLPTGDARPGPGPGPPAKDPFPSAGADAFWAGDYAEMARIFRGFTSSPNASWEGHLWLGHACQLAGNWQEAVAAYKAAIEELDREIRGASGPPQMTRIRPSRRQLCEDWAKLALLVGRIELVELEDPAAAVETLLLGLRHAPEADRPVVAIADDAATAIEGLASPYSSRLANGRPGSELMYPLAAHRHLAMAYEQLGDVEAAVDCWTRIRLCRLAYLVAMSQTDPVHIARLWAKLPKDGPRPPMPIFLLPTRRQPEVSMRLASGESRLACWESNAWDTFAVVPPPGEAVASLRITCTATAGEGKPDRRGSVRCWVGDANSYSGASRLLLEHRWPKETPSGGWTKELDVDVPYDTGVVFLHIASSAVSETTVSGELRPRGQGQPMPEPVPPGPGRINPQPDNPFRPVAAGLSGFTHSRHETAALAELPDGRLLSAFGTDKILMSTSRDGAAWDQPWEYPHNSVFPTGAPALLVDDDRLIWMLYVSKRPGTDRFSSGHYCLWITHSNDGRNWATPKPVRTGGSARPRRPAHVTRSPDGRYWIFFGGLMGSGDSPGDIKELTRINVPIRNQTTWPANPHATFDGNGNCHLVFDDFGRTLYYSRSDDMHAWSTLKKLGEKIEGSSIHSPQLICDGGRAALIYTTNQGTWLRRGVMQPEGPRLGKPIRLFDHRITIEGARLLRSADKLFLPVRGNPPQLLQADLDGQGSVLRF